MAKYDIAGNNTQLSLQTENDEFRSVEKESHYSLLLQKMYNVTATLGLTNCTFPKCRCIQLMLITKCIS